MSKEMTPKEALRGILLQALFINPNTKIKEEINNKMFALREIVEKALNSLEETNFNYHNALAFCEASKEEKQELYKQIKQLEKENQELKERYKHRAEISSDLNESLKEYEKAIEKFIDYLNEEPNRQICKHSIKQVFNKFLEGVKENV